MEPFNEHTDILLIQTVEKYPVLYDFDHPKSSDTLLREQTWRKVGAALNRPSKMCKMRWVNIRDALRRKVMQDRKNGNKNKRKYKYEDKMGFVKHHFKDVTNRFRDIETKEEYEVNLERSGVSVKEPLDSDGECGDANGSFEFQNVHLVPEGSIDPFLLSIGATLRQLSPYYLNQAKTKIFQVVQEYELAQIIDKDGRPSTSSIED